MRAREGCRSGDKGACRDLMVKGRISGVGKSA